MKKSQSALPYISPDNEILADEIPKEVITISGNVATRQMED